MYIKSGPQKIILLSEKPWQKIIINFIIKLLKSINLAIGIQYDSI